MQVIFVYILQDWIVPITIFLFWEASWWHVERDGGGGGVVQLPIVWLIQPFIALHLCQHCDMYVLQDILLLLFLMTDQQLYQHETMIIKNYNNHMIFYFMH